MEGIKFVDVQEENFESRDLCTKIFFFAIQDYHNSNDRKSTILFSCLAPSFRNSWCGFQ